MTNIKTNIRGIQRNTPDAESDMGSAQEIINMRHRDGAWRAIGKKQKTTGSVQVSCKHKQIGWYHHPSNVDSMLLSFNSVTKKILLHNTLTGTNVVVKKRDGTDFILPSDETFNCFGHLENVLILFGCKDRYNFLWTNGAFEYVEFGGLEWTCTKADEERRVIGGEGFSIQGVIGEYRRLRSLDIDNGFIEGICSFRIVVELMDGSFVWYSDIKTLRATSCVYLKLNQDGTAYNDNSYGFLIHNLSPQGEDNNATLYWYTRYRPVINFSVPEWLTYYIDLGFIKAMHVSATKPIYPEIPDEANWFWVNGANNVFLKPMPPYTCPKILFPDELDKFHSIYEINIYKKTAPSITEIFKFKNIDTNLLIKPDNFTGNKTSAKYCFNYNQRLHLQQIYNSIPPPLKLSNECSHADNIILPPYIITPGYKMYVDVIIAINNSFVVKRTELTDTYYYMRITQNTCYDDRIYVGRFFYYPHMSAREVRLSFSKDGVNFYKVKSPAVRMMLTAVTALNIAKSVAFAYTNINMTRFAYSDANNIEDPLKEWWQYDNYRYDVLSVPLSGIDYATDPSCEICTELDGSYTDTNRVQLSELSNPFVLPANNSYRFGDINNEVNGIEVTHEQLSETRFGEYPLYVFTVQGVFALKSGSGSIVYSSLDYLKKHKVTDHQTIMNSKGYVVFRTDEGFFALSGREFTNISTPVQGSNVIDIQSDTKFQSLLDGFNSNDHNHLSIMNFLQNTDFIACHDHVKDELWLSLTSSLDASYIFSFDTKSWFKSAETFQYFVDLSPDVVGIRESHISRYYYYDFYDMHKEDDFSDLKLFVSRPISFGSDYYKRIEHFVSRIRVEHFDPRISVELSGSTVLSTKFYLYGSIDGFEYKIIQGGEISDNSLQDQEIRRCFVDFKYLIIVIGFNHENCELVGFESEVKEKFKTKLR